MPFDSTNTNKKLSVQTDHGHLLAALNQLEKTGKKAKIKGKIKKRSDRNSHFQGVAVQESLAYLSLSSKVNGSLFVADGRDGNYEVRERLPIMGYNHPGGMQAIGTHVAVPVYGGNKPTQVHVYDSDLNCVHCDDLETKKAFCVGIANVTYDGGERYILAVVSDSKGDQIDFYKSEIGLGIGNGGGGCSPLKFHRFKEWHVGETDFKVRDETLQKGVSVPPDKIWLAIPIASLWWLTSKIRSI